MKRRRTRVSVGLVGAVCSAVALSASAGALTRSAQSVRAPALIVFKRSTLDAPGYVFVAPKEGPGQHGPEILDDKGRPVWFHRVPYIATDFRVQRYQEKPVLTWWEGPAIGGGEPGVDYIADSSYHVIATVRAGSGLGADAHEFVLTPEGTALVPSYREVPYDLSSLGGPKNGTVVEGVVQEVDVATGHVLFEWHSLDHVPVGDSYEPVPSDVPFDYLHLNSVNLDNDGNLLISGRHAWTVYKVNRHTGQVIWRLGGKHSDFALGSGVRFAWQHDALAAGENTIRVFDNESIGTDRVSPSSRVIWIHVDPGTKAATLVKAIQHPGGLSAPSEGSAQGLANGNTFVGWGALGRISEFDPQGKLLFDARLPVGDDTYRGYRFDWAGEPTTRPTANAHHSGRRKTVVHAVWNGATGVARWRVLAGRRIAKLVAVRTVAWSGLDTAIKIRGTAKYVRVVALDAHGGVVAKSKPVRVRRAA